MCVYVCACVCVCLCAQLDELTRRFNEADIDGLRALLNELDVKVSVCVWVREREREKEREKICITHVMSRSVCVCG